MKKPFNNKLDYDPGRLRHLVRIYQIVTTELPDGSTQGDPSDVLITKAGIERKNAFGSNFVQQQEIEAGVSIMKGDRVFVIRNRPNLNITTKMKLFCEGVDYEIVGFVPQDDPIKFIKIACSRFED